MHLSALSPAPPRPSVSRALGMRITLTAILLFLAALVAKPADLGREAQAQDVLEAALRYKFAHNGSGLQNRATAYFISLGGSDPSDEFIKRFVGHAPPVRKASACRYEGGGFVLDRATGRKGLLFSTEGVTWKSDTEVQVALGYYEQGLSADWCTYTLRKEKGKWKVTDTRLNSIS